MVAEPNPNRKNIRLVKETWFIVEKEKTELPIMMQIMKIEKMIP